MTARSYFISGTDTGCGKTRTALSLMEALKARGYVVAGMKPVATGAFKTDLGLINEDAELLRTHGSIELPYEWVNPYVFERPCSPNIAAGPGGHVIDMDEIVTRHGQIAGKTDIVIVEGIGGWRVPFSDKHFAGDIARYLEAPVLLVVGLRLGCINHALLTVEAISKESTALLGWVANRIDPAYESTEETIAYLTDQINAPLIGSLPYREGSAAVIEDYANQLDVGIFSWKQALSPEI